MRSLGLRIWKARAVSRGNGAGEEASYLEAGRPCVGLGGGGGGAALESCAKGCEHNCRPNFMPSV